MCSTQDELVAIEADHFACKSELQSAYGGTSSQFMDNASPSSVSLTKWQCALPLHVQTRLELGVLAALPTSPQLALGCSSLTGVEGFSADAQRLEIDPLTMIRQEEPRFVI